MGREVGGHLVSASGPEENSQALKDLAQGPLEGGLQPRGSQGCERHWLWPERTSQKMRNLNLWR